MSCSQMRCYSRCLSSSEWVSVVCLPQAVGCPGRLLVFHSSPLSESLSTLPASSGFFSSSKPKVAAPAHTLWGTHAIAPVFYTLLLSPLLPFFYSSLISHLTFFQMYSFTPVSWSKIDLFHCLLFAYIFTFVFLPNLSSLFDLSVTLPAIWFCHFIGQGVCQSRL